MGKIQEILRSLQTTNSPTDVLGFLLCIGISFLFSVIILIMYRVFFSNRSTGAGVDRAFLIIGPAVTTLLLAIQFSLPLSLGLLGSLSFVRFRTPIKYPEEIGYVLLLIASSIGCATYNYALVFVLLSIVLVALALKRFVPGLFDENRHRGLILVSLKEERYQTLDKKLDSFMNENFGFAKLERVSVTDGIVSLSYRFKNVGNDRIGLLAGKLKETAGAEKVNVFLEGIENI